MLIVLDYVNNILWMISKETKRNLKQTLANFFINFTVLKQIVNIFFTG
ncbi:hypothetical protein GCAAIG_00745 [Candidatus Electronema halotolerans]